MLTARGRLVMVVFIMFCLCSFISLAHSSMGLRSNIQSYIQSQH